MAVFGRGDTPPAPTPPARQTAVTAPAPTLYDSRGFTGPEWKTAEGPNGLGVSVVGGEYRIAIRGEWRVDVWRPSGHGRISVEVAARIIQSSGLRLDIDCGFTAPGGTYLTASIRPDATWEISANNRVLASGPAPARAPELSEPFLLRMECVTDTSPTRRLGWSPTPSQNGRGDGS